MREFDTGATRDTEEGKLDYRGFMSHEAMKRFAEYMHSHRTQADGKLRDSDNWKKGIPTKAYMSSMYRHFMDVWGLYEAASTEHGKEELEEALCALWFNVQGMLHEVVKERDMPSGK